MPSPISSLWGQPPGERFEESEPRGGTARLLLHTSRAAALGDLDNDGDIDIVVANKDSSPYLLRNRIQDKGNWIMLRLLQRHGRDAIGALVRADAGSMSRWRTVQPAYGYCSSSDPRVHFGLGETEQVDSVLVRWPDGQEESFGPFLSDQTYTVRQGTGH